LDQLTTYGTSIVGLYPGFGKTVLGSNLVSSFKYRVVILVHREVLTTQWKKTFEDNTDAKVWIVPLSKTPVPIDPSYNVIICMITRVKQITQKDRDDIGFLIIDEAHAFCTPESAPYLLWFHPQYVLVETATLMRDDGMEKVIYSITGTHGVYRDSKKPFVVYKVETGITPKRKYTKQGKVNYSKLVSDTLLHPKRNDQVLPILEKEKGNKILVLTALTEHVDILNTLFLDKGYNSDSYCGKKKSYIDKDILVGTVSKIGTGFDPANACKTYDGRPFRILILMCSIKKYALLVQVFGRIFRDDFPVVYFFVDGDGIFGNHWTKASKWVVLHEGKIFNYKESKKMKI
jgi:superfamily II DNA or RNA helicase